MEKDDTKLKPVDLNQIRELADSNDLLGLRQLAKELIPENRLESE